MTARITWSGDWTYNRGLVNGMHLLTIERNVGHTPDGHPFRIRHKLPGFRQSTRCWATEQHAKEAAETFIAVFIDRLTNPEWKASP